MAPFDSFNTKGIVLRIFAFSEADLIIRALTEDCGLVSLLARHARASKRRFSNQPDLFDRGTFTFSRGRGALLMLREFTPVKAFASFRTDLNKFAAASTICECFEALIKEESEDPAPCYRALESALEAVERSANGHDILAECCQALSRLLYLSGFMAEPADECPMGPDLNLVLDKIEAVAEKQLKSRSCLLSTAIAPASISIANRSNRPLG